MARILGILLCAGSASRMGFDKMTTPIGGSTAVERSARALMAGGCTELLLTAGPETEPYLRTLTFSVPHRIVAGGVTRQDSVKAALAAAREMAGEGDIAVIHDGARCMVTPEIVADCIESVRQKGSGIAAARATDTVLLEESEGVSVIPRDRVLLMQTPQCFYLTDIWEAYEKARGAATDDCTLYAASGKKPAFVLGTQDNFKLTTPADWRRAERLTAFPRFGTGYDTHRLVENRRLVLGGVEIPYEKGLLGHSDADVLLHAIMDALLGAVALGDIGQHFPDQDPAYQDADSRKLLEKCRELLLQNGYVPCQVDATILAQRPKLAPYIPRMRENIAITLGLDVSAVSVKATTTEGMNDEGKGLCISTMATAGVRSFSGE